jgi:hypothetical protein
MEVSGQLHASSFSIWGEGGVKNLQYPSNGPYSWSGCNGVEKNLFAGIQFWFLS